MRAILVSLPCSLVVALFASRVALSTLHMPTDASWTLSTVLICTLLLIGRSLFEMAIVAGICLLAQLNASGLIAHNLSQELLLALLVSVLLLPATIRVMGLEEELGMYNR